MGLRSTLVVTAALLLMPAGPAVGAVPNPVSATCGDLQTKLTNAQDGDVITLNSSDGTGGFCTGAYNLPTFPTPTGIESYKSITLQGDPSNGLDGFDRNEASGRALTGDDSHIWEIMNLTFRDGRQTGNGGAISLIGESSLGLRNSHFFNNHATGRGGAVYFSEDSAPGLSLGFGMSGNEFGSQTTPSEGNQAAVGGAVSVESHRDNGNSGINGSVFANNIATTTGGAYDYTLEAPHAENVSFDNNTVVGNKAGGSGGGGHVVIGDATILRFDQELYQGNSVEPMTGSPSGGHFGGGLYVEMGSSPLVQRQNRFLGNSVQQFTGDHDYGGGGEAIAGNSVTARSEVDTFTGNSLPAKGATTESEGGGLFVSGAGLVYHGWLNVIAANQIGAGGEGGGAYAGAPPSNTALEFADSTIAGNSVGLNGSNSGLGGGGDDRLLLHNTIVHNTPAPDIGGFGDPGLDVQYSDACESPGTPFTGAGNICADPLLVNPAGGNIHETLASPTVDKGNDGLFLSEEEDPCCDFEGDPRPTDGDGDGHTADIGADESPAFVAQQQPPPTPEQCADGKDNDNDGAIDLKDPGCSSAADNNEGDESLSALVLCGSRQISLVRADAVGKKAVLSGIVAAKYAGKKVSVYANYPAKGGLKKVASVKAAGSGQFTAKLKLPSKKGLNKARFQARIGNSKSATLKLPQSLASSSVKRKGARIELRGKVKRSLLGKRNAVIVRRLTCGHYTKVGQAKPGKSGSYVVRFDVPAGSSAALYRAETTVLARPRGKKYVKQYARAIGITFSK